VSALELAGLVLLVLALLALDLHFFARDREPGFREGLSWSIGWLVLSLAVALPLWAIEGPDSAVNYTTVYLIERSLSLDNLFVFIVLFGYFAVPVEYRARLLFFGIVLALVLRGLAILGGVALIERFEPLLYVLGLLLILLALRLLRGVEENVDPDRNLFVRAIRRLYPVTSGYRGRRWFVSEAGRRHVTPLFLCLGAIGFADITFAIDSIPAAFGITRDSAVIWMGNAFALMGLRALFVLVETLLGRLRYLDQTIAVVLGLVGLKLIAEEWVHISAPASLGIVLSAFALGTAASLLADRRDAARERAGYSRPTS
jgi:tellurite resistance protein TerC